MDHSDFQSSTMTFTHKITFKKEKGKRKSKRKHTIQMQHVWYLRYERDLGPVVQSVVSLTSLLLVKMLTVLVSTISNSQVFLLKNANATHIFSAKILSYMPYSIIKVLMTR